MGVAEREEPGSVELWHDEEVHVMLSRDVLQYSP